MEVSSEVENVQEEMATNGPHKNASHAGVGHHAPGGGLDGIKRLEPEAYPAL
jgi:hypothetical protein